jgi:hypothetical protein
VRDLAGIPVPRAKIRWGTSAGTMWPDFAASDDGTFTIRRVPTGRVNLWAGHRGIEEWVWSDRVQVDAGARDVTVPIDTGPGCVVRVVGESEDLAGTRARLFRMEGARRVGAEADVDEEGAVRFRGLDAERSYTLWIGPTANRRLCLLREGVRASDEELAVALVEGLAIRGRLLLPPGARGGRVRVERSGCRVFGVADDDGRFEITGLPAGEYEVNAQARAGTSRYRARTVARAGETVELDLTREPR